LIDQFGLDSTYYSDKGKQLSQTSGDGGQTNVKYVTTGNTNTELPSDAALTESLDVINRTEQRTTSDTKGGLHGESSIVMKDGTVIQGTSGAKAFINSNNELVANETLPGLPSGKTANDVETTIHLHVTGTIVQNNQVYSHDATVPSNTDLDTFSNYRTNIIVGPLGQATGTSTNGVVSVSQPSSGVVIYKGASSTPQLILKERAVKRILK
jgi:hypothetical protein